MQDCMRDDVAGRYYFAENIMVDDVLMTIAAAFVADMFHC